MYGCESWSLALREEHRLRVFEDRVLRIIFGTKRDEVFTRATRRSIPEDDILHSHCRENLKSYIALTG
jgi:hypothetical protein